jgi:hypothetical protein
LQILLVIWNLENVMIVLAPIHNCLHLMWETKSRHWM